MTNYDQGGGGQAPKKLVNHMTEFMEDPLPGRYDGLDTCMPSPKRTLLAEGRRNDEFLSTESGLEFISPTVTKRDVCLCRARQKVVATQVRCVTPPCPCGWTSFSSTPG